MNERRLRDIVRWDAASGQATANLRGIAHAIERAVEWVKTNQRREERSLVLFNPKFRSL